MSKSKEIAVDEKNSLPVELINEMALDAGAGQEDITAADVSIPFLRILQQMSPQCVRSKGEYIEGAQSGQIFNTVTGVETSLAGIVCSKTHPDSISPVLGFFIISG